MMNILKILLLFSLFSYAFSQGPAIALIYTSSESDLGFGFKELRDFGTHKYYFPNTSFYTAFVPRVLNSCLTAIENFYVNQGVRLVVVGDNFPDCAKQGSLLHSDLSICYLL